jgi:hypothetical protein
MYVKHFENFLSILEGVPYHVRLLHLYTRGSFCSYEGHYEFCNALHMSSRAHRTRVANAPCSFDRSSVTIGNTLILGHS